MQVVAKFEKVSKQQFINDFQDSFTNYDIEEIEKIYDNLKLPKRATVEGWFLAIFPRSGLGFKYRLQLNNTVGIIDSDYYHSDNEGHIFIKITNDSNEDKTVSLTAGQGFGQGIFMPFGIVEDDDSDAIRNGGFGSTTK